MYVYIYIYICIYIYIYIYVYIYIYIRHCMRYLAGWFGNINPWFIHIPWAMSAMWVEPSFTDLVLFHEAVWVQLILPENHGKSGKIDGLISLRDNLQENRFFNGKIYGFLRVFPGTNPLIKPSDPGGPNRSHWGCLSPIDLICFLEMVHVWHDNRLNHIHKTS